MSPTTGLTRRIDQLLGQAYTPAGPGAAVLLAKDGQTLYRWAIGLANLELSVPLAPEMIFRIAALTKPFTAQAVLMLAEAGQLAVTDSVAKYLPECANLAAITLEHLLTHTSGLVDYTTLPEWWAVHRQDLSVAELLALFTGRPLESAPGARWAYNDSGYILLGAVIEAVAGQTYAQFIEQQLLAPLGMHQSSYEDVSRVLPGRVTGYQVVEAGYQNAEYLSPSHTYAAGALLSTVDDLARWSQALFTGRVLQPETLRHAFTPYRLTDGNLTSYGYGWFTAERQGRTQIEHPGALPGFAHYIVGIPAERLVAVVLSNRASQNLVPDELARRIIALASG